jgi:argininosuccinate lyase
MKKLWEKNIKQDPIAEAYCFGDTLVLDNKLVPYDIAGSIAHAKMLQSIGILSPKECKMLIAGLREILILYKAGTFTVQIGDEDVHTKVEGYLTKTLGDVGKKLHTGRSRNDQVLVDLRLYSKDQCVRLAAAALQLADHFMSFARKHEFIPMPGYTHIQKAMPSSVGMWAGSFAESLVDDVQLLQAAFMINDQNPLGSGAAYGVSLPINRELTSTLLGFAKTQNNSLYCQVSRPKSHLAVVAVLTQIMMTLSRFASDLLLFTTSEFGYFTVVENLTTGSSIMPQKNNLDVMEYLRANAHAVAGDEGLIASTTIGLPSGYNADFGQTKRPLMHAIDTTVSSLAIVDLVLSGMKPNIRVLHHACTPELFATHAAYELVKKGMPFRDAYKKIGVSLHTLKQTDPICVLKESNHTGGPGNLGLTALKTHIATYMQWWKEVNTYENKNKLY